MWRLIFIMALLASSAVARNLPKGRIIPKVLLSPPNFGAVTNTASYDAELKRCWDNRIDLADYAVDVGSIQCGYSGLQNKINLADAYGYTFTDGWLDDTVGNVGMLNLGGELVANGTFDTDITGLTVSDTTASWDAGRARCDWAAFSQTGNMDGTNPVDGQAHLVQFDLELPRSGVNVIINVGNGAAEPISTLTGNQTYTVVAVSGTVSKPFGFITYIDSGESMWFDNVSLKQIVPETP